MLHFATFCIQPKCVALPLYSLCNLHWILSVNLMTSFQALFSIICSIINMVGVFLGVKFYSSHILLVLSCFSYISICISLFAFSHFAVLSIFFPQYLFWRILLCVSVLVWILCPVFFPLISNLFLQIVSATFFGIINIISKLPWSTYHLTQTYNTLLVTLFFHKLLSMIYVMFPLLFFSCTTVHCLPVVPACCSFCKFKFSEFININLISCYGYEFHVYSFYQTLIIQFCTCYDVHFSNIFFYFTLLYISFILISLACLIPKTFSTFSYSMHLYYYLPVRSVNVVQGFITLLIHFQIIHKQALSMFYIYYSWLPQRILLDSWSSLHTGISDIQKPTGE